MTSRRLALAQWRLHLLLICLAALLCGSQAQQADDNEYLNEVLEEAAEDYTNSDPYGYDDTAAEERQRQMLEEEERRFQQAQDQEKARQAEADRIAKEKVQQAREAAFEAELLKMDEENQKKALKQKRKDRKVVNGVLRAADRGDLYRVLGLRNWEVRLAPRSIRMFQYEFEVPCRTLFHISPKAIRKAYREAAKRVHPDKNRDGRAVEAFVAVEEAASILSDEDKRVVYDEENRQRRGERQNKALQVVGGAVGGTFRVVHRSISVVRRVLGPFAFPLFILTALII